MATRRWTDHILIANLPGLDDLPVTRNEQSAPLSVLTQAHNSVCHLHYKYYSHRCVLIPISCYLR